MKREDCYYGFALAPVILPLASEGGCQLTMMVRGRPSLLTTVTSFGAELGAEGKNIMTDDSESRMCENKRIQMVIHCM